MNSSLIKPPVSRFLEHQFVSCLKRFNLISWKEESLLSNLAFQYYNIDMSVTMCKEDQKKVWNETTKIQVWEKGKRIPGFAAKLWRRDVQGKAIQYTEYNNPLSPYGWYIDATGSLATGNSSEYYDLQPICIK